MHNSSRSLSHRISVLTLLFWTSIAGLGGAVRYIALSLDGQQKQTPSIFLLKLTGSTIVSGFTGLMMALFISKFTNDPALQYVAAGVSGYTGPKTLDLLFAYLKDKFLPTV